MCIYFTKGLRGLTSPPDDYKKNFHSKSDFKDTEANYQYIFFVVEKDIYLIMLSNNIEDITVI